jgi:hypothetical protein
LRQNALGAQRTSEPDVSHIIQPSQASSTTTSTSSVTEAINALSSSSITALVGDEREPKIGLKRESNANVSQQSSQTSSAANTSSAPALSSAQSGKWEFFKGLMRPSREVSSRESNTEAREREMKEREAREAAKEPPVTKEIPQPYSRMLKISIVGGMVNVKAVFNLLNNENSFVLADTLVKVCTPSYFIYYFYLFY